jgi:hypothetical protein
MGSMNEVNFFKNNRNFEVLEEYIIWSIKDTICFFNSFGKFKKSI